MRTSVELNYSEPAHPCEQHVYCAQVVGRVRDTCCGTYSEFMFWDVFRAHVVGRVRGPCCGDDLAMGTGIQNPPSKKGASPMGKK